VGQTADTHRNGTTHVSFNPLDFIARLAALVPKPRVDFGSLTFLVNSPEISLRQDETLISTGRMLWVEIKVAAFPVQGPTARF